MSLNDSLRHSRKTSWQIRDVKIPNALVIAPMAGVSNIAFRSICKRFGAGLVCAEMVSDKALYYENGKTLHMTRVMEDEHPMSLQIFGHDIESMVYAAKLLDEQSDCDIIDINMGCPVNKVIKAGAGLCADTGGTDRPGGEKTGHGQVSFRLRQRAHQCGGVCPADGSSRGKRPLYPWTYPRPDV